MRASSVVHTRLTDSKVDRIANTVGRKDLFVRDSDLKGFGLRVSPANVKSYFVEATVQGRFTRKVVGQHPFITATEARKRALEALRNLKYGQDSSNLEIPEQITLKHLAATFLAGKAATLRPSTIKDYRMALLGTYFEPWANAPLREITKRGVLSRYGQLVELHGAGMANKAFRVLSAAINYGRAIYPSLESWSNPVTVLGETRAKVPLSPRTSHIPPDQLGQWLLALDQFKDQPTAEWGISRRRDIWLLLYLLLMTGLRSNEARSLRWRDLDLDAGELIVRKEVAKNRREARLPLNTWLVNELTSRPQDPNRYVFEASCAEGYLSNLHWPLKELHAKSRLRITPHDLRRSFATYLDLVGAPFGATKQLLNHSSSSDVTARYIQRRSTSELRIHSETLLRFILAQKTNSSASVANRT